MPCFFIKFIFLLSEDYPGKTVYSPKGCTKVMGYRVAETFEFTVDFLKLGLAFLQLRRLFRQLIFRDFALGYVVRHVHGANKLSRKVKNRCCAN
jgi:hypothetical protein